MSSFRYKLLLITLLTSAVIGLFYTGERDIRTRYRYDKITMLTRFVAKEYCSCRFVTLQSDTYCRVYASATIPVLGLRLDSKKFVSISVTSPQEESSEWKAKVETDVFFFVHAAAVYLGEKGCRLTP